MKTQHCPTDAELQRFDSGELSAARSEELAAHFDSCPECAARFERLEERVDGIVQQLQVALPEAILNDDSEVHRLVEAARKLGETSVVARAETQAAITRQPKPSVEEVAAQYLAPAQGPDELGRLGGYRVLWMLGRGGMGVVFQAEDIALKRIVALKVMNPQVTSDAARTRFLREAQSNAAVRHDNVVTIFQVGEDRGVPFFAMELLEGQSLANRLRSQSTLAVSEALQIAREMAQGLSAAHAKGLTHRDIKPDNVWLEGKVEGLGAKVEGEDRGVPTLNLRPSTLNRFRVKILDFGLARAMDDEQHLTQEGAIVGTPNYLSPEQAAEKEVDPRTDQFSLGVVLYEMLSGRKPFAQSSLMATLKAIGTDAPRELDSSIPADVAALVQRLLEKRPEDRFASCHEVIEAIEACVREEISRNALASGSIRRTTLEPDASADRLMSPPKSGGGRGPRRWLASVAAAFVLMFGVIVTVKDKNGKTLLRYLVPDGGTVEVTADNGGVANKSDKADADKSVPKPVTPNNTAPATEPQVADHLPPMSPTALVQRPPKLVGKESEAVQSWTLLPVRVSPNSARALSADGSRLATFGSDGAVRVWDVDQQKLTTVLIGHSAGPCSPAGKPADRSNWGYAQTNSRRFGPIAWRPQVEGKPSWLATASRDGSVRVCDVSRGATMWKDARDGDLINMLSWSPDGTKLAVGYDDGQVRICDAESGQELAAISLADGPIFGLGWSPDSKRLAVHSSSPPDGVVVVWEIASGKQQRFDSTGIGGAAFHANHPQGISAMRWSPDGKQLAVKEKDGLRIYEAVEWKPTHRLTSGQKDNLTVQDFDWSPDGTTLLVSWNGLLQRHDLQDNKTTLIPLKDKRLALKVEWPPNSPRAAIYLHDGIFSRVAILESQSVEVRILSDGIYHLHEFGADNQRLLCGGTVQPCVVKFDGDKVTTWTPLNQSSLPTNTNPAVWSPDGQWLYAGGAFWNVASEDWLKSSWTPQKTNLTNWSPDSRRFLGSNWGRGTEYEIWLPQDRQGLAKFELPTQLFAAAWSPDGSQLAVGTFGSDGEVVVLDGMAGQVLRRWKAYVEPKEPQTVQSIAWSRRGDRMAVSYHPDTYVIDANDGKVRFALENVPATSGYQLLLWGPDDRRLLVAGVEELSVFDGDTGKYQTSFALQANPRAIHFLDADNVLCGTRDGTVHRRNLATGQQELVTKLAGNIIEISPDGQLMAVEHGGLSLHRLDGQRLVSFVSQGDSLYPWVISAEGHFWNIDQPQGPFWSKKAGPLVYVVQTAKGQQTFTPLDFANRYGWQNDPSQVRLK